MPVPQGGTAASNRHAAGGSCGDEPEAARMVVTGNSLARANLKDPSRKGVKRPCGFREAEK
jgi:hypothetical protein